MRLALGTFRYLPLVLAIAAGASALPAKAESLNRDQVYADSFGNLVVHSRAGYKRIIVGAGWDPLESTCRHASLSIL